MEYIRAARELYEAFVLSSFLYYIIELGGGEEQMMRKLLVKDPQHGRHGAFGRLFGSWQMGRPFLTNCKYGVLQYVLVKIVFTIAQIVLGSLGKLDSGDWGWDSAYAYLAVLINLSIAYALYCLVKLYFATKEDLKEWNPVGKFLCIKGIVSGHPFRGMADFFRLLWSFFLILFRCGTDFLHFLARVHHRGVALCWRDPRHWELG